MKTVRTVFGHLKLLSRLSKMRFFGKSETIETSLPAEILEISKEDNLAADKRR
jgi:hypothetical protein